MQTKVCKLGELSFDKDVFQCYSTNSPLDPLLSSIGGLPKGVNYLIVGDPGVGKTTLVLDLLSNLKKDKPSLRTLFISAEMTDVELFFLKERFPKFSNLDVLFVNSEMKCASVLREILNEGWDIVAIDSFAELLEIIKDNEEISSKKAESLLLQLIKKHNSQNNQASVSTSFLIIQQVTKLGNFLGSNRLKHAITAMMELRLEDSKNPSSSRYVVFTKHRRGQTGIHLFYDITEGESVYFDIERFNYDQRITDIRKEIERKISTQRNRFSLNLRRDLL